MVGLLITLLVICLIASVVWWILTMIPIPPPFVWIVRVIFAVIFLIVLLDLLLGGGFGNLSLGGGNLFARRC